MTQKLNKKEIRKKIREEKLKYPISVIDTNSYIIVKYLLSATEYANCDTLFCYVSFNQEVNTKFLLEQAFKEKEVAVPKIVNDEMKFYYITSYKELQPGNYGILEPVSSREAIPIKTKNNLCIVPGLAFDNEKNRIGYGKGYYDTFFHKYKEIPILKNAIAFDFQVLDKIPADNHDEKMDLIITPTRVIQ